MNETITGNSPEIDTEEIRTGRICTINISAERAQIYQLAAEKSGFGYSVIAEVGETYPTRGFRRYSHLWDAEKEHLSIESKFELKTSAPVAEGRLGIAIHVPEDVDGHDYHALDPYWEAFREVEKEIIESNDQKSENLSEEELGKKIAALSDLETDEVITMPADMMEAFLIARDGKNKKTKK